MSTATRREVTIEEFLAKAEREERIELIRGTIVEKAAPLPEHSLAQSGIDRHVGHLFARRPGGRLPGGWWFFTELDIRLGREVYRPDICGYRRERMPEPPRSKLIELPPDWVCEILSPSNADRDRVEKLETYFKAGIPHYWIVDPAAGTLEVLRHTDLSYALVLTAHRGQKVRAEPFDAVELKVDELLGGDPEDESAPA